jgi:hypothetical protein
VADGLRTPGLLARIEALEEQKSVLEAMLEAPAPSPVRLHPNLAELYRKKATALCESLADPLIVLCYAKAVIVEVTENEMGLWENNPRFDGFLEISSGVFPSLFFESLGGIREWVSREDVGGVNWVANMKPS